MKYSPLVAIEGAVVVGIYVIKPNQMGRGAHIANGAFMVHPKQGGKGIGKPLGLHALELAKSRGFKAMQFNIVVATHEAAVRSGTKLGFEIVGTIPDAYPHRRLGYVDAYVMYQNIEKDILA
jgi:GNAT superfamily N-acetyltransferase